MDCARHIFKLLTSLAASVRMSTMDSKNYNASIKLIIKYQSKQKNKLIPIRAKRAITLVICNLKNLNVLIRKYFLHIRRLT